MDQQLGMTRIVRRLVGGYLLSGVLGLLIIAFLSMTWVAGDDGGKRFSLVVLLQLGLSILGTLFIRRIVRVHAQMEQQLLAMGEGASLAERAMHPILDSDPLAVAWNGIQERLRIANSLSDLEACLSRGRSRSPSELEPLFAALPVGLAMSDAEGKLKWVNSACASIFRTQAEALSERNVFQILQEGCSAASEEQLQKLSRSQAQIVAELRRGKEIAEGVIRVSRSRLPGDERSAWSFQDVTQQKLADEARNQFVLTATHELRTPLTNIKALAEMISLEEQIEVEDQKRFCNTINAEATRLSRFVNELLDLNQLEAGSLAVFRTEVDFERLLSEVVEHVRPEIEKKRIDFALELPAKLPKLRLDKDKIAGALVNLLGNAVKYTPDEGRVRLLGELGEDYLVLTVEDSGIGIAEDELPRVFEKFFRSGDDRVRQITGSGLGLAFTQEVIERHGGRIHATSELDKGSRFTVHLPLTRKEALHV